MHSRILIFLVTAFVLVGIIAGCGGGDQQNKDNQSSGSKSVQTSRERTGKEAASKEEAVKGKWVRGTVAKVDFEKSSVFVKPKNEEVMGFMYRPKHFKVLLDGEEVEPETIEQGQQAAVGFFTVTGNKGVEVNLAQVIRLTSRGSGGSGGETTG